ncbi:5-(carboxyamino)imidazole ribonucleotide mutase [bacterium]|nr:5-(carboxyamino)imidazole ribonucleotide mutase [bacterium]
MAEKKFLFDSTKLEVAIVMGSTSDWEQMKAASDILCDFEVSHVVDIVSAHRTPDKMFEFAKQAKANGLKIIIAGAGGAAHLPGMIASKTTLPVIGVPVKNGALNGQDALYSIVQMPRGIPVATVGIGNSTNAGLLATQILAAFDDKLSTKIENYRKSQSENSLKSGI